MFICRDRTFLKKMSGLLNAEHFKPRKGEGMQEAYWIAQKAFKFWKDYREPIGGMLQTEMLDYIRENKRKIGSRSRDKLMELVQTIRKANGLVAVEAVEKKVVEYLQRQNKARAIKDLIEYQEKGELSDSKFQRICKNALEKFDTTLKVSDFTEEDSVEKRIKRRKRDRDRKYPSLLIKEYDKVAITLPRGEIAMGLSKWGVGKSTLTAYLARAYAIQTLNVLVFTLEDPSDMVENRLDALFSGIKIKRLVDKEKRLRKRMRKALQRIRGHIKVIDGTDGNITIARMEEIWENFRNQGFTADVLIVDYDEGVVPPEKYKGDSAERQEMRDIYKEFKSLLARRDLYGWIMAQTTRGKPGQRKMIVTGDDAATDISKVRRCALCLGIGDGPEEWGDDSRYIYIAKHRYDRPKRGFAIMGDFERSMFYSEEATDDAVKTHRHDKE